MIGLLAVFLRLKAPAARLLGRAVALLSGIAALCPHLFECADSGHEGRPSTPEGVVQ